MPRIISGSYKGMKLKSVAGTMTRPTSDKVKGAVFNILAPRIIHARVLDLFAGTGQMGLEAISRGASNVVFVEHHWNCVKCIEENVCKANAEGSCKIILMDVFRAIPSLSIDSPFDIVYIDPPYHQAEDVFEKVTGMIVKNNILAEHGVVVFEHSTRYEPKEYVINLKLKRSCKYGSIMVSFYEESNQLEEVRSNKISL
jgi:16S rRNA (guanine966-N2)-methyltransferase